LSEITSPEEFRQLEKQLGEQVTLEFSVAKRALVVCIPAFNAEKKIGPVVTKALKFCDKVIVCDDGSIDDTSAKAMAAGAHVIRHSEGLGKEKTMNDLMEEALKDNPSIVVTLSLEEEDDPADIPELVDPILKDEADITVGVRETAGLSAPGGAFVALNSKALAARVKQDFLGGLTQQAQMASAIAAGLRLKVVTFAPKVLPPSPKAVATVPGRGSAIASLSARWDRFMRLVAIERPFAFVCLPGVALALLGLGLMAYGFLSYMQDNILYPPLFGLAGVSLFVGVAFIISYTIIYVVEHYPPQRRA
jgi:hypothetical protein